MKFQPADEIEYADIVVPRDIGDKFPVIGGISLDTEFEPQDGGALCGLASAVICMNKLTGEPGKYSQAQLLERAENAFWPNRRAYRYGLCMVQVAAIIRGMGFHSEEVPASNPEQCFQQLSHALLNPGTTVIANFWRTYKGHRGGHFSPLSLLSNNPTPADAGHNPYVLLMDTSASRAVPHWLPLKVMVSLMCRPDRVGNNSRGFLVVSRTTPTAALVATPSDADGRFPPITGPTMATEIVRAHDAHVPVVWGLLQLAFEPVAQVLGRQPSSLTISQDSLLTCVQRGELFLLRVNGRIAGIFTVRVSRSWNCTNICHVAIGPDWQKQGLGAKVMDAAECIATELADEYCARQLDRSIMLSTYKEQPWLVQFYAKRGYQVVKETERLGNTICWFLKALPAA